MQNSLAAAAAQASAKHGWIPDGKNLVIIAVLGGVALVVILAANKKGSGKGWLATLGLVAVLAGGAMFEAKAHPNTSNTAIVAPGPSNHIASVAGR